MSSEKQEKWYFDFSENSKEVRDADSDDPFGSNMRVATQEDVAAGRADYHFELIINESGGFATISGIKSFTQNTVVRIIDESDSFSAKGMDNNDMADLEFEITEILLSDGRVTSVNDVTVRHSERPYENEIGVSMTIVTDHARYSSGFFIGDAAAVDVG